MLSSKNLGIECVGDIITLHILLEVRSFSFYYCISCSFSEILDFDKYELSYLLRVFSFSFDLINLVCYIPGLRHGCDCLTNSFSDTSCYFLIILIFMRSYYFFIFKFK